MGLIRSVFGFLLGGGARSVTDVAGAFIPNAEAQAQRQHDLNTATLAELGAEFALPRQGWFGRFVDGLNRLPRPLIVLSCFGVLIYTPLDPIRMTKVFTAWALIPSGLWAVMLTIVGFYFGGRMQIKSQEFQQQLAATTTAAPRVIQSLHALDHLTAGSPGAADTHGDAQLSMAATTPADPDHNQAITDWMNSPGHQSPGEAK